MDLDRPLPAVPAASVGAQCALVRLHGRPVGLLWLDPERTYGPADLRDAIVNRLGGSILDHLVEDGLVAGSLHDFPRALNSPCPRAPAAGDLPVVTVAVCTRNRASQLAPCLDALQSLDYPSDRLDIVIVDNAPADDRTERAVRSRGPRLRYVQEPRPGLDWARNRAILEARGAIVAFTDDDVIVDVGWVRAIAQVFAEEPDAMCVTGLVLPEELDTAAQVLFEQYGGFARGFSRRYAQIDRAGRQRATPLHGGTGKFGTGANMAFRRTAFDRIGPFDPALDVGTDTNGGGDLEMFFRVIKEGKLLVYEPAAVVRHRHRREYAELRTQVTNNGIGFYSYLVRSARAYPDERGAIVRLGIWWLWFWSLRRLVVSLVRPRRFPRDLILAEMWGSIRGLRRYSRARKRVAGILNDFGPQQPSPREAM